MMKPLSLSPFPTRRADDASALHLIEREGFVDEAVVTALVRDSLLGRRIAYPDDLALAADDLDFAGWSLSKTVPPRSAEVPPQVIDAIVRRASPQVSSELRRDSRHPRNRRQWLVGLATLPIAALIVLLAARPETFSQAPLSSGKSTVSQPAPLNKTEPVRQSPKLSLSER